MIAALKNAGEVVTEILMTRQVHKGSFLVLEGPDDSRFWEPRVCQELCEIVIAGCKHALVCAIQLLDSHSFKGAVGLVDDDCDRLRSLPHPSPNIVYTDTRDLEGVLLQKSAFSKVLAEYGDRRKIERFEAQGKSVSEALVQRALPLGRLQWLALAKGAAVDFTKLKVARFMDPITWSFDEQELLRVAVQQGKLPSSPQLEQDLASLTCSDPWLVCRGHDLVQILGFGLEHVLGNRNPGDKKIGAILRAGLDERDLTSLLLYQNLRHWEAVNPPYRILR